MTFVPDRRTTDKNIYVLPFVLLRVYARSKWHRILLRQHSRVETKRFSTRRYMVWSRLSVLALVLPTVFPRFVGALACLPTLTLRMFPRDGCEALGMHQTNSIRRYGAQGTTYPQPRQESRSFLRCKVWFSEVLYSFLFLSNF